MSTIKITNLLNQAGFVNVKNPCQSKRGFAIKAWKNYGVINVFFDDFHLRDEAINLLIKAGFNAAIGKGGCFLEIKIST